MEEGLVPRMKLWVEWDGGMILSDFCVTLLHEVAETGSLSRAAGAAGMPYRQAWGKLKELEQSLGAPLLESARGGSAHGSSRLTPLAADLAARFQQFRAQAERAVEQAFVSAFAGLCLDQLAAPSGGPAESPSNREPEPKAGHDNPVARTAGVPRAYRRDQPVSAEEERARAELLIEEGVVERTER